MRCSLLLACLLAALLALSSSPVLAHSHHHCAASSLPPLARLDSAASCQTCQAVVEEAYQATQNATEMAALLKGLQAECALNASTALICDIIAAAVVKELPKLPAKLYGAGWYTPAILCAVLSQCSVDCCSATGNAPSQVHLSVAGAGALSPSMMTVTWITADDTADTQVRYGTSQSALSQQATADTETYTAGGWVGSIHTATMTGLQPNQEYYYQVGGPSSGWSAVFSFTSLGATLPANFTWAVFGDLGAERNYSAGNQDWINLAAAGNPPEGFEIDAVLHIGDISYADGYMERWDELFTTLQPAASTVPYMTVPGNHEIYNNFSSYQHRLPMPTFASGAPSDGMWYSFDAGCVHFVALNSESTLDTPYISAAQVAWLQEDLAAFAQRRQAGREARAGMDDVEAAVCTYSAPTFLVAYMHRPMYCSAGGHEGEKRCGKEAQYLQSQVESIFQQYEVDLVFAGHVHAYERSANVFQGQADPSGPVYILDGAGGNREGQSTSWQSPLPPYSEAQLGVAGLGHLRLLNSTALQWQFFKQTDLVEAMAQQQPPVVSDEVIILARGN